jgi:hypothetical protein
MLCAALLAGCGGSDASSGPLDDALGYFPKNAPLVVAIDTDRAGAQAKALGVLVARVPAGDVLIARLLAGARLPGLATDPLARPVLGHPLVVGLPRVPSQGEPARSSYAAAIRVDNPAAATQLLLRRPGMVPDGETSGRRVFRDGASGMAAAVDGNVVVVAGRRPVLEQALAVRRSRQRLRERELERRLRGLPHDALVRLSADPRALMAGVPALRPALSLPWLAALGPAGATLAARDDGLHVDVRIQTDAARLVEADLPLEPRGGPAPLIGRPGELSVAVHGPRRLARFAAAVAARIEHGRRTQLREVERRLNAQGIHPGRDFADRLGGAASIAVDLSDGSWAARVGLRDPDGFRTSLMRVATMLPDLAAALGVPRVGVATPEQGAPFFALAQPREAPVVFGVVGDALVAASSAMRAAGLAHEQSRRQAPGSLVAVVDARVLAERYVAKRLKGVAAAMARMSAASLGELRASVDVDRAGLRGSVKLAVR